MGKSCVHPSACVDPSARVDPSAEIGPGAVIGPKAVIGPECRVGANAVVERAVLGRGNVIFPGAFVGGAPQDLKYRGEETRLVLGERNVVREAVTLNRGSAATGETVIGNDCLFMAYSHVAHDCRVGNGVIVANGTALAGHVEVGDGAVISGMVGIHQYVRIGAMAMIGGGAMLGKDVPPYCTAQGDRAKIRGLNVVGLRRARFPREAVAEIREAYRAMFLSGEPPARAAARLLERGPRPEAAVMLKFVLDASKRGFLTAAAKRASPASSEADLEEAVF